MLASDRSRILNASLYFVWYKFFWIRYKSMKKFLFSLVVSRNLIFFRGIREWYRYQLARVTIAPVAELEREGKILVNLYLLRLLGSQIEIEWMTSFSLYHVTEISIVRVCPLTSAKKSGSSRDNTPSFSLGGCWFQSTPGKNQNLETQVWVGIIRSSGDITFQFWATKVWLSINFLTSV